METKKNEGQLKGLMYSVGRVIQKQDEYRPIIIEGLRPFVKKLENVDLNLEEVFRPITKQGGES